jgi:recombination protein RecT
MATTQHTSATSPPDPPRNTALVKIEETLLDRATLERFRDGIGALERWGVTPQKLARVALTAVNSNEDLVRCNPRTIVAATLQLAQVGLVPDGFLGQAYLIPYNVTIKRGGQKIEEMQANPLIGYRGYGELIARSGKANSHDAQVAYERDVFDYEQGSNPFLRFKRVLGDRGKPLCAYCIVYMKEGPERFEIMDMFELAKIEGCARGTDNEKSPWRKWKPEMWRKSPVRRLAKYLALSEEFQRAATIDESSELGYSQFDEASGAYILDPEKEKPEPIQQPEPVKNGAYTVASGNAKKPEAPPAATDAPPAKPFGQVRERTIDTSETQEEPDSYDKQTHKSGKHISKSQHGMLMGVLHKAQKRNDEGVPSEEEFFAKVKSLGYKDARYLRFKEDRKLFDALLKWADGADLDNAECELLKIEGPDDKGW